MTGAVPESGVSPPGPHNPPGDVMTGGLWWAALLLPVGSFLTSEMATETIINMYIYICMYTQENENQNVCIGCT